LPPLKEHEVKVAGHRIVERCQPVVACLADKALDRELRRTLHGVRNQMLQAWRHRLA